MSAVSVVVPTYNRAAMLPRVLRALEAQRGIDAFEIVLVDDGSVDDTAAVAAQFPSVRYLRQDNAGPAAARNRGWRAADGDIIAFTDDDTVPDPSWLSRLVAAFADDGLAGVGGGILPLVPSPMAEFVRAERHVDHGRATDGGPDYLVTANAAFRRTVLEAADGFDERFPGASGEDVDLSWRVRAHGGRLGLVPDAVVQHDHRATLRQVLRTYRRHGASRHTLRSAHAADDLGAAAARAIGPRAVLERWHRYRTGGASRTRALGFVLLHLAGIAAYGEGLLRARWHDRAKRL